MIKITADSTCDLPPEIIQSMDITIIPLHILVGELTFEDGVNITPADIFNYVEHEGKICKTAAVNAYEYKHIFEELSTNYEAIIHINISSDFSSCYQNALLAARGLPNVYVVDSRNLSTGSGHLVYDAALMAKNGVEPEEIYRRLTELTPQIEASFVIDCLDYLSRGGRCSTLNAQGAKLLKIKPCIEVIDGRMTVGKKYRGSLGLCLQKYIKDRLCDRKDIDYSRVFVTHSMCPEETVQMVKETIDRYAAFDEVIETRAGCTVSSHCGPNTLGILFKRKAIRNPF
jgi:DegV family protein with EDD domain